MSSISITCVDDDATFGGTWADEATELRDDLGLFMPDERTIGFVPPFEVRETDDAFLVAADVPGVRAQDLTLALGDRRLTVRGRRAGARASRGERCYAAERTYGEFHRSFDFPSAIDAEAARATLDGGVLTIHLEKRVPGVRHVSGTRAAAAPLTPGLQAAV